MAMVRAAERATPVQRRTARGVFWAPNMGDVKSIAEHRTKTRRKARNA
jgi:hypothetical protein